MSDSITANVQLNETVLQATIDPSEPGGAQGWDELTGIPLWITNAGVFGQSIVGSSTELIARQILGLGDAATRNVGAEEGTVASGTDTRFHESVSLSTSLTPVFSIQDQELGAVDHGADRLLFWDESANALAPLELGVNLSISGTTLAASGNVNATVTAGTNAQGQAVLTSDFNVITTAAANPSGATLPSAAPGRRVVVMNRGANAVNLYPQAGASINAQAANAAISLPAGSRTELLAATATSWESTAVSISTGVQGLGAGVAAFLAAPTTANLAAAVTGEVGTGALLFGTAPAVSAMTVATNATITASGTNTQGQGVLSNDFNVITTAVNNPSGVTLPTATVGRSVVVVNRATNPISVFPASGAQIDSNGTNTAISIPVGGMAEFIASATTQWQSNRLSSNVFSSAVIAYAASVNLDMALLTGLHRTISLTGGLTFTSSNREAGRFMTLRLIANASDQALTFPAGWTFTGQKPSLIAANKTAVLKLSFFGTADTDCIAEYSVQP